MARLKFAILANSSLVNGELAATGLLTTEPNQLPDNSTWFVMSNLPDVIPSEVGNTYRLRTWIEYGLQLIIQPYIYYCLLRPWLKVFENWHLRVGFSWLMAIMNEFSGYLLLKHLARDAQPTVSFRDEYCAGTILSCHFLYYRCNTHEAKWYCESQVRSHPQPTRTESEMRSPFYFVGVKHLDDHLSGNPRAPV